jgi:hypothetical protein
MNSGLTSIRMLLTALKMATPTNACRVAARADRIEGCPLFVAKQCLINVPIPGMSEQRYERWGSHLMNHAKLVGLVELLKLLHGFAD